MWSASHSMRPSIQLGCCTLDRSTLREDETRQDGIHYPHQQTVDTPVCLPLAFEREMYKWGSENWKYNYLSSFMKSQVLHAVWCCISGEAAYWGRWQPDTSYPTIARPRGCTIPERPQTSGLRSTRISTNYKTQRFKQTRRDRHDSVTV